MLIFNSITFYSSPPLPSTLHPNRVLRSILDFFLDASILNCDCLFKEAFFIFLLSVFISSSSQICLKFDVKLLSLVSKNFLIFYVVLSKYKSHKLCFCLELQILLHNNFFFEKKSQQFFFKNLKTCNMTCIDLYLFSLVDFFFLENLTMTVM